MLCRYSLLVNTGQNQKLFSAHLHCTYLLCHTQKTLCFIFTLHNNKPIQREFLPSKVFNMATGQSWAQVAHKKVPPALNTDICHTRLCFTILHIKKVLNFEIVTHG